MAVTRFKGMYQQYELNCGCNGEVQLYCSKGNLYKNVDSLSLVCDSIDNDVNSNTLDGSGSTLEPTGWNVVVCTHAECATYLLKEFFAKFELRCVAKKVFAIKN